MQHITEQKLCCTFSKCSWCDRLNLRKKTGLSALCVRMRSVVEQGFFHKFAFDNKHLKQSSNFESVENVQSSNVVEFEFELHHIPNAEVLKYWIDGDDMH